MWVKKFDSGGAPQWVEQLDIGVNDRSTSIAVSGTDVYITGYTVVDLDGAGPEIAHGYDDAFLAKYDSGGTLQWIRQLGTTDSERSHAVAVDSSGRVYLSGRILGNLSGPGPSDFDVLIATYSASGTLEWLEQIESTTNEDASDLAIDNSGGLYVAGTTWVGVAGPDDAWVARVLTPAALEPFISSFTPTTGLPGTTVIITGGNFNGVSPVKFNGLPAAFTVNSSTQITATVPSGATTGKITVETPCGRVVSAMDFIVPVFQ